MKKKNWFQVTKKLFKKPRCCDGWIRLALELQDCFRSHGCGFIMEDSGDESWNSCCGSYLQCRCYSLDPTRIAGGQLLEAGSWSYIYNA